MRTNKPPAEREAKADNMDKRMSALKVKSATKDRSGARI